MKNYPIPSCPTAYNSRGRRFLSVLPAAVLILAAALLPQRSVAADPAARDFDIPAGEAPATLDAFSAQSGSSARILYSTDDVAGAKTNAVKGQYTALEAAGLLVAGTTLEASLDSRTGTISIHRKSAAAAKPTIETLPSSHSPDNSDLVHLSPFEVQASQDLGYLASNAVSATRMSTRIADLPFAISALTPELIADTGSTDLYSIVRYAAGVTSGSYAYNFGTSNFMIRGFQQPVEHDGFYESSQGNQYVDTVNIERVEVVKGPASLLYGQIAPGGTVNYITKRAGTAPFANVTVSGGSYHYGRAAIDINQPLVGNTLLFRFNGAVQNDFQYQTPSNTKTVVLDPTLTWNISPKVSLKLNYQWFYKGEFPPLMQYTQMEVTTPAGIVNAFNPAIGSPPMPAALVSKTGPDAALGYADASDPGFALFYPGLPRNYNICSANDYRRTTLQSVMAELDFAVGSHWNGRALFDNNTNSNWQFLTGVGNSLDLAPPNSLVYSGGAWSVAPSWTAMTSAQQLAAELAFGNQLTANPNAAYQLQNGTPAPVVSARRPRLQGQWGDSRTVQVEMAGNYDFGWVKLKPLVGLYYDVSYVANWLAQNTGSAASPYFQAWDVDTASPTYFINHNTYTNPASLTALSTNNIAFTSDQAAYGIINGSFLDDRLFLVAGLRYNQSQSQTTNYIVASGVNPVGQGYRGNYTTPQAGIGFKVVPGLMLYASYSESYSLPASPFLQLPQVVNGVTVAVPVGQAKPVTGKGYDVGLKTDFLNGRISSTLSFYEINENNVEQALQEIVNGVAIVYYIQQTTVRGRGVEYECTLTPLTNWQIFGSIALEDIRNTAEPVGYLYYLGEHPYMSAHTLANLWTRYTFDRGPLKGLWIGGGFNYVGEALADPRNAALLQPAYTLWNSAVGYDWMWKKTKMSLAVNWENMSNERYQPTDQVPGYPERAVASWTTHF